MPTSSKISKRTPRRKFVAPTLSCIGTVDDAGTAIVSGMEYRIIESEDVVIHDGDEMSDVRGAVNPYTNTIILDRSLGKSQKELTLLHELIHAVDEAVHVGLDEVQTTLLAAGLYGLQYTGPRKRDKTRTMRGVFYG